MRTRATRAAADDDGDERFVLSTFGLISAGKGIETVIEALPAIIERHPEVVYVVAGRTHPDVAHREGERYRLKLEQTVVELGLEDHVEFDDRFLAIDEIADLLAATDVFVTPYKGREQIASGALTFGIAAGCGVVSTPYWYAQDMLASGAGELVPFDDPAAIADAVCRYIDEPERLAAARAEARRIGAQLAWPSVAEATAAVLSEAVRLAPRRRRPLARLDPQLVTMRTDHLLTLVDDVGIVQHANGVIPNRQSGYCVDDVARLAVVALELARRGDEQTWTSIVYRSLAFLQDATDPERGMRNFMGYDRRWLDEPHSATTSAARSGRSARSSRRPGFPRWSARPDDCSTTSSARSAPMSRCAPAPTPCSAWRGSTRTGFSPPPASCSSRLVDQLADAYETHATGDWHWFEDSLTYDNARLPHALIVGGAALGREDLTETGLNALLWLGRRVGARRGNAAPDRAPRSPPADGARPRRRATSSRSTPPRSSRPSSPRSPSPAIPSTACVRSGRSTGSSAGTGSTSRSTTSRPAAAATGSARRRRTTTRAPSRRSPFHRAALLLDAAGLPAVLRDRTREHAAA